MTDEELFDALDGLFAYDTGCTDSGIHDAALKERVKLELAKDTGPARLTVFAYEYYMDPPYTLADVAEFINWLADEMDVEL